MFLYLFQFSIQTNNSFLNSVANSMLNSVYFYWFLLFLASIGGLIAIIFGTRKIFHELNKKNKAFNRIVLQVLVPGRKKSEGQGGKVEDGDRLEQIKEDIAVAQTFFSAVAGLKPKKGIVKWFTGREDDFSFEIVVDNQQIKFFIDVPKKQRGFIEQQIHSQYPDAEINEMIDYNIFNEESNILGAYLDTKKENIFPIKNYKDMDSDPLDSILNPLASIHEQNSSAAIQYIIRPTSGKWRTRGSSVVRKIKEGNKPEEVVNNSILKKIGKGLANFFSELFKHAAKSTDKNQQNKDNDHYQLSSKEEEMLEGVEEKISKGGLEVTLRIISASDDENLARTNLDNLLNAFGQYNLYKFGNSFEAFVPRRQSKVIREYIYRSFNEKRGFIANTEEMASLWHPPLSSTEAPNIEWMSGRQSAPPSNIPKTGLKLGFINYRGQEEDVYLQTKDRRRHLYIVGKTGSGKSVHISNMAKQDVRNGSGLCILDPHGDLAEDVLSFVPKERADDVIYFNPADKDRPLGINMLEAETEEEKDLAVQEMIGIFQELFPPEMIGPMFEHHMRNVMLTLMADPENPGTLIDIPKMFTNEEFAGKFRENLDDPVIRSYWEEEMDQTSDHHKSEMLGYLISKIGRFSENMMMRNILGQQSSSFDFREVMDKEKILIINLSKGQTGEVNAKLLGLMVVSKLTMAALQRADMKESERNDFYLYIDEFQNFITDSISVILSEARKYRLSLIMAHQYMGQLEDDKGQAKVRDAVLGNVGSMMSGRIGPDDAEILAKEFAPTFGSNDLMNPPQYHWYTKMIIDSKPSKPFLMGAFPPEEGNEDLATSIKELARLKYGRDVDIVREEVEEKLVVKKSNEKTKESSLSL